MAKVLLLEVAPPRFPIITETGQIKMVSYAPHVATALEVSDGEIVLRRSYERRGWVMLQDLYAREGRLDLWKLWLKHRESVDEARRESRPVPAAWPAKLMPKEVQRRRAGHRPDAPTFVIPADVAPVDMSDDDVEPAPPVKRGRKPKVESESAEG